LEKVAQIGGMDAGKLINTLRRAVVQVELAGEAAVNLTVEIPRVADDPEWIAGEPQFTINGTSFTKPALTMLSST